MSRTSASAALSGAFDTSSSAATVGNLILVDDDPSLLEVLRLCLERAGHSVRAISSATEARGVVQQVSDEIDVIISDVSMDGMSGVELMSFVHEVDPAIPVVLFTGMPSVETAVSALEGGAFKFLMKPVDPDELLRWVQRALQRRRSRGSRDRVRAVTSSAPGSIALHDKFDEALEKVWIAFQPIVDLEQSRVFAYEALVRSTSTQLARPDQLLQAAEQLGRLHELGRTIRSRVAQSIEAAPADANIFVNLHAADLVDPDLYREDSPLAEFAARVVFEVTERVSLNRLGDVGRKLEDLRRLGYRVAVDDLGAGYAALSSMTQLRPEVVKLDMSVVRGIDQDDMKQRLVAAMVALCGSLNILLVAEGVETEAEQAALTTIGARYLQGYLYARPQAGFVPVTFPPPGL